MNHLEIKHLRMIQAIEETGIMTRAAQNLCITQSALSQQLKDIETKLKADLFFRTKKKMVLTPVGKKLLKTAKQIIESLEDAELDIARRVTGDAGELKVGTQCLFCYKWLPGLMDSFQKKYPNVEFELGNSDQPAQDLISKKYDIVVTGTCAANGDISYTELFKDQMRCVMPPDHPLAASDLVEFRDFQDASLISHSEKEKNFFYLKALEPNNIKPKRFMTVSQPNAMLEMVAAGFGLAIMPAWALGASVDTGRIVSKPITRAGVPVTWYAASLNKGTPPVFQMDFIRMIRRIRLSAPEV